MNCRCACNLISEISFSFEMENFKYHARNFIRNADGLNVVIRSLSSRIRSVILVRVRDYT